MVNVTVFTGNLTLEGLAEEDEETIGGLVFYNNNDSDDTNIMDLLEDIGRTSDDVDWATLTVDPIAPIGLGGTYTLMFTGGIRVWADNGDGTFSYLQSGVMFDATTPPSLFVEGFSTDGEEEITLDFVSESGQSKPKVDLVKVESKEVVLEWAKIADAAGSDTFNAASGRLEHDKALHKNKGAYILLNDDDDDFDGNEDNGNTVTLSDQENDLLPIYVKRVKDDTGNGDYTYTLVKTSELRLWTDVGGSKRKFTNADLFFGGEDELTFYVDAKEYEANPRSVTLKVVHNPSGPSGKPILQKIYVNVFKIEGPQNVPDFSVYEYDVESSNVVGRAGTMWITPGFGQLKEPDPVPGDNIDAARLFWNVSPKIAKARYQATTDYVWARDINVVKIDLSQGTIDDSGGQNPTLTFEGNDPNTVVQARSATGGAKGLQSTYSVDMTGPTRNGGPERGRKQMLVGYMQLLTATTYTATYKNGTSLHHGMQGSTYVDTIAKSTPTASTEFPWYDSGNLTSQGVPGEGLLTGAEAISGRTAIAMSDTPYPFFLTRHFASNQELQTANFLWEFELIIAVGTLDAQVEDGARYPYFRRAVSTWNYHGTIVDNGPGANNVTLLSGAGVSIGDGWTEEENGVLAFDQQVVTDAQGVPATANVVLNAPNAWFNGP